jgi:putative O-methyltransferase
MSGLTPTESYLTVHYELRPAKQVERRMLVDALLWLSAAGFRIQDYQYTGMGSVYFIDFMLFHRLIGFQNMLSVEHDSKIARRVEFNRPFDCVDTKIEAIGNIIPRLSKDIKHVLWLDYDGVLTNSQLGDIASAASQLSVGSILLITIDVEPPTDNEEPRDWMAYFEEEAGEYFNPAFKVTDFTQSQLPRRNADFIWNAIKSGMAGRTGTEFIPMFNFVYEDGHQMLTMGGMIGTAAEKDRITESALAKADYFRRTFEEEPCLIKVPRLTRKERQYLDGFMPCPDDWLPPDFELSTENVLAYRQIYRFCPTYAELLL